MHVRTSVQTLAPRKQLYHDTALRDLLRILSVLEIVRNSCWGRLQLCLQRAAACRARARASSLSPRCAACHLSLVGKAQQWQLRNGAAGGGRRRRDRRRGGAPRGAGADRCPCPHRGGLEPARLRQCVPCCSCVAVLPPAARFRCRYVSLVAGTALFALAEAKQKGQLSEEEFSTQKAALLRVDGKIQDANSTAETASATAAYTWDELANHASAADCWVAVHGQVYDFTCFFLEKDPCYVHPGNEILLPLCGRDGTEAFDAAGHRPVRMHTLPPIDLSSPHV
eukprot:COSAG05_NODE_1632_length_4371_cov_247.693820_2_plen_282_part_00